MYSVKEIFTTLQGEGYHTGTPAIFVRFTGCNLWSGFEKDRLNGKGSCSKWCDTNFINGTKYTLEQLVNIIKQQSDNIHYIVFTGGEPLLQLDESLLSELSNYYIAIETNGTILLKDNIKSKLDWICVSPKAGTQLQLVEGNELKLIYPQLGIDPEYLWTQYHQNFEHFFIQPLDNPNQNNNTQLSIQYCQEHPHWRLSLQTQKYINIR